MDYFIYVFSGCVIIPLCLCAIYIIVMRSQYFNLKAIIKKVENLNDNETIKDLISISIKRVNGWLTLSAMYSMLLYLFEAWGIIFGVLNLYVVPVFSKCPNKLAELVVICSLLSSISTSLALVFKLKDRWLCFRNAHNSSCLEAVFNKKAKYAIIIFKG